MSSEDLVAHRLAFVIPGPPIPKARARRGAGGRWYTPTATQRYERHVGACGAAALLALGAAASSWPMRAEYMIRARVFMPDARRRDVDNVVKSICDGLIGVTWADDHRVGIECPPWQVDRGNPRVELTVEVLR